MSNQEVDFIPMFIETGCIGAFGKIIRKVCGTTSISWKKYSNSSGPLPNPCSQIRELVGFTL